MMRKLPLVVLGLACALGACREKPSKELAPAASALAPASKATEASRTFVVDTDASQVTFQMDAPLEKIYGAVDNAASGELFVDLADLTKTRGLVRVDLEKLVLTQQKREAESAEFGEKTKSDLQNQHARAWLEISEDAPAEQRKQNALVEFKIVEVVDPSERNVLTLTGPRREVTATVKGEFLLHQRKAPKQAKVKVAFEFDGETPKAVTITTVEPFEVNLEEHDVRPREAFGKLAEATLETVGKKVDKTPGVTLNMRAKLK
jgi:hypothetical protein